MSTCVFNSNTIWVRDYYNLFAAVLMCRKLCTIASETVVSVVQRQFSFLLFFFNNTEDIKGKPHGFSNLAHLWQMFGDLRPCCLVSSITLCAPFFCSVLVHWCLCPIFPFILVELWSCFGMNCRTHICFRFVSPSCLYLTSCTIANLNSKQASSPNLHSLI